jgi:hypothetical protein
LPYVGQVWATLLFLSSCNSSISGVLGPRVSILCYGLKDITPPPPHTHINLGITGLTTTILKCLEKYMDLRIRRKFYIIEIRTS